jgi:hypothetical protein
MAMTVEELAKQFDDEEFHVMSWKTLDKLSGPRGMHLTTNEPFDKLLQKTV